MCNLVVTRGVTYKKIVFSLFTKKPKITLSMNTFIKNMLCFSDEIKRSKSVGGKKAKSMKSVKEAGMRSLLAPPLKVHVFGAI